MAKRIQIASAPQMDLFGPRGRKRTHKSRDITFVDPDPNDIFIGSRRLEQYLGDAGLAWVMRVRALIREQDLCEFEARYQGGGRHPYAPAAMIGLILYGLMLGVTTLRRLEDLAVRDLGCMWVCGGITPDHSVLGRFLINHRESLTESFFESLTTSVLRVMKSGATDLAGDGTVIRAVASRYRTLQLEAARKQAKASQSKAEQNPQDEALAERAALAAEVAKQAETRAAKRKVKGRSPEKTRISPTEPEAVVQTNKESLVSPCYKPSILANEDRVIVANSVHPSSETEVLPELLNQVNRINQSCVERIRLDAGYFSQDVLEFAVELGLDILCPQGKGKSTTKRSEKMFLKNRFIYDSEKDCYTCPAGNEMSRRWSSKSEQKSYVVYQCDAVVCNACENRDKCTKSLNGRRIKRYQCDELKEAAVEVLKHPAAKREYLKRMAWVEPIFGELRHIQSLNRFERKGLESVKLEFSLHAMAHNLRRLVSTTQINEAYDALESVILRCLSLLWCHHSTLAATEAL